MYFQFWKIFRSLYILPYDNYYFVTGSIWNPNGDSINWQIKYQEFSELNIERKKKLKYMGEKH